MIWLSWLLLGVFLLVLAELQRRALKEREEWQHEKKCLSLELKEAKTYLDVMRHSLCQAQKELIAVCEARDSLASELAKMKTSTQQKLSAGDEVVDRLAAIIKNAADSCVVVLETSDWRKR